jgi:molybdopterin-guanine dinucleotide biosynthesis protein A
MGTSKAALEWHGSSLLRRTCGVLSRAYLAPVVVVRAPGQPLPTVADGVDVVDDPEEGFGPMQGIATGLAAVTGAADVAFVCSTDLPFLHAAFVRRVLQPFADDPGLDVVLPVTGGFRQPLLAGYRTSLASTAAALVRENRLKPAFLFEQVRVLRLDDEALLADPELRRADPALESAVNINEPDDYAAARARPAPQVTVECFGVLASRGGKGRRAVPAATVGDAAAAVGLELDRHVLAAVNGDQTTRDPHLPLQPGDTVAFLSADAGG